MTQWIDINLPWYTSIELPKPEYPTALVDRAILDRFGTTEEMLSEAFEKKHGCDEYSAWLNATEKVRHRVYEAIGSDYPKDIEDRIQNTLDNSNDQIVLDINDLKRRRKNIREFQKNIPEVIAWYDACDEIRRKESELESKGCFSASKLNRPGVLIEVQFTDLETNKTLTRRFLLGSINCLRGVCDDCTAFERDAIVLRAKVLVDEGELKMDQSIRELAYRLWQARLEAGVRTSHVQDWVDAEKMYSSMKKEDIEKYIADIPMMAASEPEEEY